MSGKQATTALPGAHPDTTRLQVLVVMGLFAAIFGLVGVAVAFDLVQVPLPGSAPGDDAPARGVLAVPPEIPPAVREAAGAPVAELLGPGGDRLLGRALATLPLELPPDDVGAEAADAAPAPAPRMSRREARRARLAAARAAAKASSGRSAGKPARAADGGRAAAAPPAGPDADEADEGGDPTVDTAFRKLRGGDPRGAYRDFKRLLEADPGNLRARLGLARAAYQMNMLSEARDALDRVLAASPSHGSALLLRASIAQEQGQAADARRLYRRYIEAHPNGQHADEVRSLLDRL